MIQIRYNNTQYEISNGTTFRELALRFQKDHPYRIILAAENGKLRELHHTVKNGAAVGFLTVQDKAGLATYKRSLEMVMLKAIRDLNMNREIGKTRILFALSKGIFCLPENGPLTEAQLEKIRRRMKELIEKDIPFEKKTVPTDEAIALFAGLGMWDKAGIFSYRRGSSVNLYYLEDYMDYYYGYMAYSTGSLSAFELYLYEDGFVLQMPERQSPES